MLIHPSLPLLSHTFSRTDLFTAVFCLVDDWMKQRYHSANAPRKVPTPPESGAAPKTASSPTVKR